MIIDTDPTEPAREAARNNAAWCAALCRAHGITGHAGARAWTSPHRTPLYYPDAVTLTPDASAQDVVGGIDLTSPGASVKDSFAALDLSDDGFDVLFDAQWIHRPAPEAAGEGWQLVLDEGELIAWEAAWARGERRPLPGGPACRPGPRLPGGPRPAGSGARGGRRQQKRSRRRHERGGRRHERSGRRDLQPLRRRRRPGRGMGRRSGHRRPRLAGARGRRLRERRRPHGRPARGLHPAGPLRVWLHRS